MSIAHDPSTPACETPRCRRSRDSSVPRVRGRAGRRGASGHEPHRDAKPLPANGIVIDATGPAGRSSAAQGSRHHLSGPHGRGVDRRHSRLPTARRQSPRRAWLEYQNGEFDWSYRIQGPDGRVQTGVFGAAAGDPTPDRQYRRIGLILSRAAGNGWMLWRRRHVVRSDRFARAVQCAVVRSGGGGIAVVGRRIERRTANAWSDVVAATFLLSEVGRGGLAGVPTLGRAAGDPLENTGYRL